jgi:hypothetical protein
MDLVVTIIKVVLSIGFGMFGLGKVLKIQNLTEMMSTTFERFGLSKQIMQLTGLGELAGVALLWVPLFDNSDRFGGILLAAIAGLAAVFHIRHKDPANDLMPAIMMTSLAAFVAVFT